MSYFSTIRTNFTDAKMIASSCRELGFEVISGPYAYVRGYCGMRTHAEVVCILKGNYDLGFIPNQDGSYDVISDLFGVGQRNNLTELIRGISKRYRINEVLKSLGLQLDKLIAISYDTWLRTKWIDTSALMGRLQEIGYLQIDSKGATPYLEEKVVPELAVARHSSSGSYALLWVRNKIGSLDLNILQGWQQSDMIVELFAALERV